MVLFLLGFTATPALASTGQEINLLPTLDALNLHEESEPGFNWSELTWALPVNHMRGKETKTGWAPWGITSSNGAYWKQAPYSDSSGDAAAITMQVGPGNAGRFLALWLNMPSPNSVKSGYRLSWTVNSGTNYTVKLSKWSSGTETVIASNASVTIAAGTTMAISDTGGTVSAWQGTGGSLTSILSASDTTYQSGYAGIEGQGESSRSINFKAGPLMGAAVGASAVLDNLERNETPLATSGWSKSNWAENIGSARMGSYRGYGASTGLAGSYWGQENFKGTWGGTLVAGTVGTGATPEGQYFALWLNMPTPSSTRSGYEARFTGGGSAGNYKVELSKWLTGTRTVLASTIGFSLPAGTTMALTKSGSSLVLWTGTGAMAPILSASDAAYVTGYAGLEASGSAGTIYNFKAARVGLPAIDTSISGLSGTVIPPVSFSFSGPLGTTGFECALDGEAYAGCTSPKSYPGVSEGSHTFHARAIGVQGVDETPAERTIQVAGTGKLATKVPLWDNLERSEAPLATGKWSKASWAENIGSARMGSYRGYGSSGGLAAAYWNPGEPFTDFQGTLVASGTVGTGATPEGQYLALWLDMSTTTRQGYEARFTGGGSASNYKVELSKWSSGTRTVLASTTGFSLPVGTTMALTETPGGTLALYTGTSAMSLALSASDSTYSSGRAGLEVNGSAGTIYNFRAGSIDVQAPNTTLNSGPSEIGPPEKVSFTFTSTEAESTFDCSLDAAAYEACSSPKAYPSLADGKHTFRVRAVDRVGNQDEPPAESTFWVYKQPTAVTQMIPISNTTATTLKGTVNPNGLSTKYQFEYGPTASYGSKAPATSEPIGAGTKEVFVQNLISGLQGGTVYHYRVVATSSGGTAYGADRTFTVDLASPMVTFTSTQVGESTPEYTLSIHAEDPGAAATGVQRIDILLNGELDATIPQTCPGGQCPQIAEVTWKHKFTHPLDGSDHITVIGLDRANNASNSSFGLPSKVVRATLYTGNPAQGGTQIAEEWSQLHTHESRRQESTATTTRGSAECPEGSYQGWCSFLRSDNTAEGSQGRFSEAIAPIGKPNAISEAATLSMPSQSDFGKLIETGPSSAILQSWQTLPPGAGTTFEKVMSSNEADAATKQASGEWIFWVDSATKLPLKASLREGTQTPHISYYTYGASLLEAGNLGPKFFMLDPPSEESRGCLSSGQLGGWHFTPGGFTYPDPRFNSLVNTAGGPMLVEPEGAAADGYSSRMIATADGVELTAQAADETPLHWEFTESPGQALEPAGPDVIVLSEDGAASAIIQSSTPSAMSVVNGTANPETGQSGDEIVLEPKSNGADAEVQPVGMAKQKPCVTQADVEKAAIVHEEAVADGVVRPIPSGSGPTALVKIWINPHPALQGVQVTDKYGACNGPSVKTFGSDGLVEYGGCPVGQSVTFTVPHEVSAGGTAYIVPDSSRTIKPPASGWTIDFNYDPQSGGGGTPPPPPPHQTPVIAIGGESEAEEEAQISSEQPIRIDPGATCEGRTTKPYRTDTAIPDLMTAESKFRFRCRAGSTLDYWFLNWNLSRYDSSTGLFNARKVKTVGGYGPAYENQGPYVINAACRGNGISLEDPRGKKWRSGGDIYGFFEEPNGTIYAAPPAEHGEEKTFPCG